MNCLNCIKEFTPKKKSAKFCSDLCRATFHQNKKQAQKQTQRIAEELKDVHIIDKGGRVLKLYNELLKELGITSLEATSAKIIKEDKKTFGYSKAGESESEHNKKINDQISEIEKEEIPKERDTPRGRRVWQFDKERKINDLRKQLK